MPVVRSLYRTLRSAPYGAVLRLRKGALAVLIATIPLAALAIAEPARAEPLRLVALGDSLTAGYGLPADAAFPVKLQQALKARGHDVLIENAGVSGDTASAGLARIDWSVPDGTQGVILELGANDALRGIDPAITKQALADALARLKARGIPVLLAGMRAPPNLGAAYAGRFDAIYPDLAAAAGVALYPFFLDGVAGQAKLNQPDGIHPTAAGVDVIVARMLPAVEVWLAGLKGGAKPGG
ncbi:arylesterase [Ancylobacter terrae]|uniref:arylesterase n=1 Tax=Ancylobacter sp. sgz301288 TaxID=3342077 RepID=UPI00385EAE55